MHHFRGARTLCLALLLMLATSSLAYAAPVTPDTVTKTYGRTAAESYARTWSHSFNIPNYPNFSDFGGDCTNFVSQCLKAAGVTVDYYEGWYCDRTGSGTDLSSYSFTYAWCQAPSLYQYLMSNTDGIRATRVFSTTQLQIGDLIFHDFGGDGTIDHATIITSFLNGVPGVAAHSGPAIDRPYSDYDSDVYYFVKLPNTWTETGNQSAPPKK